MWDIPINIIKLLIFKIFFFILSYFIPKNNKLLLFQNMIYKGITEEPKYAYLYAKKNLRDYELVFFLSRNEKKEYTLFNIKKHKINIKNSWKILRAKYIFIEATNLKEINLSSLIGRFNIILLYHGAFLKNETYIKADDPLWKKIIGKLELGKFKLITVPFDFPKKRAQKIFHNKNIMNISHLRNDIFYDEETYSLEHLDKRLGMNKFKRIFYYAPTHRDGKKNIKPLSKQGLKKLNMFLKKKNWVMYITAHPLGEDILQGNKFSNIININKIFFDIQEILIHTDCLITDYSSSMIDFALTEKPIIFYPYDLETYKKERGLWIDYTKVIPGPIAYSEKELIYLIKNINKYSKNKGYIKKLRNFKKRFNKNTKGNSCELVFKRLGIID